MAKKKPPGRTLTPQEEQEWQQAASLATPIIARARKPKPVAKPTLAQQSVRPERADIPQTKKPLMPLASGSYDGVDKRTRERFRKGDYPIDARLDLHGLTREEAFGKVEDFIHHHYLAQHRCLLVVTGKGTHGDMSGPGQGVLRQSLPGWLSGDHLRPYILAFDKATARHGGSGAFYVLLRRRRA